MTAPERCPTCDKPRSGEVFVNHAAGCTCTGCMSVCWRDWGVMCQPADRRARALAAESDAAKDRADAAKWRKVEPLIERLRTAAEIDASDPIHVVDAAIAILAADVTP